MSDPIGVFMIDDHALVLNSVSERLNKEPDMKVVGSATSADEALSTIADARPDVVLMDIDMPGLECFDAARQIQTQLPDVRVVFLSAFFNDNYIDQALEVRASGYITKSEPPEKVIEAIRAAASGRTYYSPDVQSRIVVGPSGARLQPGERSRASTLTPRELQILRYVARGMSQKQIAETMGVSATTVHTHTINLMTKLNIHDRVELTRFAIREGLAEA